MRLTAHLDMEIEIREANKAVVIKVPNRNKGKFRFKRKLSDGFWNSFATTNESFNDDVFLEWQVGYDASVNDVASGKKITCLSQEKYIFTGANGKKKYPYEISEILYHLISIGVTTKETLVTVIEEIKNYSEVFPSSFSQDTNSKDVTLNNMEFKESKTVLPTYSFSNQDGTYTEVIVQKQQYGFGVQPMIYFCVPIRSFSNGDKVIGCSSKDNLVLLEYAIDTNNFELFTTCSKYSPWLRKATKRMYCQF